MRRIWLSLALLLLAAPVSAQVVINPTRVEFTPSADHDAVIGGIVIVDHYEVRHYLVGATDPVQVEDVGKPTPVSGRITAPITSLPFSTSLQYVARVAAIGPTGEGVSDGSNGYFFVGRPGSPADVTLRK